MKKVISFDLDGTLVDARFGDLVWNHGIPTEYANAYNMSFDEARSFIRGQYEAVGDSDILWYEIRHWLAHFSLAVSPSELLDRYARHIELCPDARDVLTRLSTRYTLIIASNAARIFVEKELEHTGLSGMFSLIVSATTDWGMIKKETGFFRRLCAETGVGPAEMVHVGDHPIFDHDIPSGIGIDSYYIDGNDPDLCRTRQTITGLKDLLGILS